MTGNPAVREPGQRRHQPKRKVDVVVRHRAFEPRSQVVIVGQHLLDPHPLVGTVHARSSALCERGEVRRMPDRIKILSSVLPQSLPAISAQRFQNAEAR